MREDIVHIKKGCELIMQRIPVIMEVFIQHNKNRQMCAAGPSFL